MLPKNKFVFTKQQVVELKKRLGLSTKELLLALIPYAQRNARPAMSSYYVGAVGLTKTGKVLFGCNLEFKGTPISNSVHAEQFLTILALLEGEKLDTIAISAEPCGHCRQFLNEIKGASKDLSIIIPGKASRTLKQLLPCSFGPDNLKATASLYSKRDNKLKLKKESRDELVLMALKEANHSYSPYCKSYSGVAIKTKDGAIYSGFYVENAAFNPSISPLTAAIIRLLSEGREYKEIKEVILVEKGSAHVTQLSKTQELLKAISPKAKFRRVLCRE